MPLRKILLHSKAQSCDTKPVPIRILDSFNGHCSRDTGIYMLSNTVPEDFAPAEPILVSLETPFLRSKELRRLSATGTNYGQAPVLYGTGHEELASGYQVP
jgi:hypothetical protein